MVRKLQLAFDQPKQNWSGCHSNSYKQALQGAIRLLVQHALTKQSLVCLQQVCSEEITEVTESFMPAIRQQTCYFDFVNLAAAHGSTNWQYACVAATLTKVVLLHLPQHCRSEGLLGPHLQQWRH
jgi:hypothetical protein